MLNSQLKLQLGIYLTLKRLNQQQINFEKITLIEPQILKVQLTIERVTLIGLKIIPHTIH